MRPQGAHIEQASLTRLVKASADPDGSVLRSSVMQRLRQSQPALLRKRREPPAVMAGGTVVARGSEGDQPVQSW